MLRKRLTHAQRIQEIITALIRNGLGFIVKDLGMFDLVGKLHKTKAVTDDPMVTKNLGERIRLTLEELGPTFIKLGQLASTRFDLFPQEITRELAKLQDDVKPVSFSEIRPIIEEELGKPLDSLFLEISPSPVASASIGQVHRAKLPGGEQVAIKIQRPNIEKTIVTDLEILRYLTKVLEERTEWAKENRVYDIVHELSTSLLQELDYTREAKNSERCQASIKNLENVCIPKIYWPYTTKRVLTMEYIEGQKLEQFMQNANKDEKKKLALDFTNCMFEQIFVSGFFHADPHPGNIFITKEKQLVLIDFGMVGRLSPQMKFDLASLIIALRDEDLAEIATLVKKIGQMSEYTDEDKLLFDLENLLETYMHRSLQQIHVSELFNEIFRICFENKIRIPPDLTMLGKALLTIEGVLARLDPDLALINLAEPFGRRLILERYKPESLFKNIRFKIRDVQKFLSDLEAIVNGVARRGKLRIEIDVPYFKDLLTKLDRITNQLSFSIVLLAFSIMMSGLIIGAAIMKEETVLWKFPVIEIGGIAATCMFLWLLYSIFKSGRF